MEELKAQLSSACREMLAPFISEQSDHRNGILLYGEPGNGKTFFAEALAGRMGWPIIKGTFGNMNSKWVGATTENIVQLFNDAMEQAPCVLFID